MIPAHSIQTADNFDWESIFEEGGKTEYPEKKTPSQVEIDIKLNPRAIAEDGGINVEYNDNLTSSGIENRDTRLFAHPNINPAQQDLTSVIK